MYTDEKSSPPVTPLDEEDRAAPPAPIPAEQVHLRPTLERSLTWPAWFEVAKALVIWVASFMLLLFIPVIVALPYLLYRLLSGGAPSAQAIAGDKGLLFFSVLGIWPAHLLTLAIAWLIVSEGGRRPFWKIIGFEWPEGVSPMTTTLASVFAGLALFGMAWLVTFLYGEKKTDLDILIESSTYTRVAMAFMATATAPLVEEVIYRGVLYRALEKAAGIAVAIPIVSLLFAGVHVYQYRNNIAVILVITLLSIVLTVSRAVTGKLLPAFIIHLVFNGIQSVFIVLAGFVDSEMLK